MLLCNLSGRTEPAVKARELAFLPVGIEIEYEGAAERDEIRGWTTHVDGSLRNRGIEYVCSSPVLTQRGTDIRVRRLNDYAVASGFVTSIRTGIHVHLNMQDIDHVDFRNILIAYMLAEPALFRYCGDNRDINPYCIPWYAAPEQARQGIRIAHLLDRGDRGMATQVVRGTNKYAGMYLGPLASFGTIEFRHLPTTLDAARIMEWVGIVQRVVHYGRHNDLAGQLAVLDPEEMSENLLRFIPVLGEHAGAYAEADVPAVLAGILPWCLREVPASAWIMAKDKPSTACPPRVRKKGRPLQPPVYATLEDNGRGWEPDFALHDGVGETAPYEGAAPDETIGDLLERVRRNYDLEVQDRAQARQRNRIFRTPTEQELAEIDEVTGPTFEIDEPYEPDDPERDNEEDQL